MNSQSNSRWIKQGAWLISSARFTYASAASQLNKRQPAQPPRQSRRDRYGCFAGGNSSSGCLDGLNIYCHGRLFAIRHGKSGCVGFMDSFIKEFLRRMDRLSPTERQRQFDLLLRAMDSYMSRNAYDYAVLDCPKLGHSHQPFGRN
jgi:hypothetical protein